MNDKRYMADIVAMIKAEGCTVERIETGKHIKAYCRSPDGRTGMLVFSVSPSDHRARMRQRSDVRRFARGAQ